MKSYKAILGCALTLSLAVSTATFASSKVQEGLIKKTENIHTKVGANGNPIVGAAVGVGIGSAFGSGSGRDAAKIVGGLLGAARSANKHERTLYGWRYIVEIDGELEVVDAWCDTPERTCSGLKEDTPVYVINGKEVTAR